MKRFRLQADATFMAKNIDEAFEILARHFLILAEDPVRDSPLQLAAGEIQLYPADLRAHTVVVEDGAQAADEAAGKRKVSAMVAERAGAKDR